VGSAVSDPFSESTTVRLVTLENGPSPRGTGRRGSKMVARTVAQRRGFVRCRAGRGAGRAPMIWGAARPDRHDQAYSWPRVQKPSASVLADPAPVPLPVHGAYPLPGCGSWASTGIRVSPTHPSGCESVRGRTAPPRFTHTLQSLDELRGWISSPFGSATGARLDRILSVADIRRGRQRARLHWPSLTPRHVLCRRR